MSERVLGRRDRPKQWDCRWSRVATSGALLVTAAACFPARTVDRESLRTAWPIQVRYERPATVRVSSPVGTARVLAGITEVRGVLTTLAGDSATVTAATLRMNRETLELRADEIVHLSIAASEVERMRQEQFSGKRTLGAAGLTLGFLLLALGLAVVLVVRGID